MSGLILKAERREQLGHKAKALIAEQRVLGNVYGREHDSIAIVSNYSETDKVLRVAGKTHPVTIDLGDTKQLALVKEVVRDPITQRLHHIAFHTIVKGEKVTAEVPIHLVGEAPALRTGKIVVTMMEKVEVEGDATHLPDHFDADVSGLEEAGDSISIADLTVPSGIEIMVAPESLIAKVDLPRAQVEAEAEEAEEGEAEGEEAEGGDAEAGDKPTEE